MNDPLDLPLTVLRERRSIKWGDVAADVLPLWVAEMDCRVADPIAEALHRAVEIGDVGYPGDPNGLFEAFTGFAQRRWRWDVRGHALRVHPDLAAAGVAAIARHAGPGGGVVICPPVYNAFWPWIEAAGARPVAVDLLDVEGGGRLDLTGIEVACAAGARVILLCSPHNPTGSLWPADDLAAMADIADRHGAVVIADEIHAPLTHPGGDFTPFLTVSPAARRVGIALHSASKAWNLAGLKAALAVTAPDGPEPDPEVPVVDWPVGHFGMLAAEAAFRHGEPWLDEVLAAITDRIDLTEHLLARHLSQVSMARPAAGYLGWLDCRALGLGDDPSAHFLEHARVRLSPGPSFGASGAGWARINLATSASVLTTAVEQMAGSLRRA